MHIILSLHTTRPPQPPWFHGDLHPGNVLVSGTSAAVFDFDLSTTEVEVTPWLADPNFPIKFPDNFGLVEIVTHVGNYYHPFLADRTGAKKVNTQQMDQWSLMCMWMMVWGDDPNRAAMEMENGIDDRPDCSNRNLQRLSHWRFLSKSLEQSSIPFSISIAARFGSPPHIIIHIVINNHWSTCCV